MSDAKNLLDWFSKRKGEQINDGNRTHGLVVYDAVNELANTINAMNVGDTDAAMKSIDRIILCEREADRIEDRLTAGLTSGALSVQEREDLLHFIKKTDKIADWCLEGGTNIQMMIETNITLPQHIWESFSLMMKELQLATKLLITAIECLQQGKPSDDTSRCVESIKDQERIIDQMNYTCLKKVLLANMDYRATMLSKSLIQNIEDASDACKECGETIMIIIVARGL